MQSQTKRQALVWGGLLILFGVMALVATLTDLSDWNNSLGTNNPGQSGNPASPHYADLFERWARGDYFPVYFSRKKIESAAEQTTVLKPKK